MPGVAEVHVVKGRPWKDAVIKILAPDCPYRPWHYDQGMKAGGAVIVVLGTDPASALAGVGIVGPDGNLDETIAAIDRFTLNGLLELETLNTLADFTVRPTAGTVYHQQSPDHIVAAFSAHRPSTPGALFGHTSLAAARVLLESGGKCAGCELQLDLLGEDARDHVHVHAADPPAPRPEKPQSESSRPYSADSVQIGPRYPLWFPSDWPATLCDSCHDRMRRHAFTSFLDFRFTINPSCPSCAAQRSMSTMYGMPSRRVNEPWIAAMGCCVKPWEWLCGSCGHKW